MRAVADLRLIYNNKKRYILWTIFIFLAALSKDNGIAWSIVPPIVAIGLGKESSKGILKSIAFGLGIAIVYAVIRLSLPTVYINNGSHLEQMMNLGSKIKGLVTWIGYTWFAADYIYIVHEKSRNIILFLITLLLSAPYILYCFFSNIKNLAKQSTLFLLLAIVITASPNLLISMSVMNAYCTLGLAAILIGYLINNNVDKHRIITILAIFYVCTAIFTDIHHWYKSWQTSLPSKYISEEIIKKTGKPVSKAYCILINNEKKYSSFCVPTDETVGWGIAMMHATGYKWPQEVKDTTLSITDATPDYINKLSAAALKNGYECVWIVYPDSTSVIR